MKIPTSGQIGNVLHKMSRRTKIAIGGAGVALLITVVGTKGQEMRPAIPAATASMSVPAAGAATLIADGMDAEGKIRLRLNKSAVVTTKVPYKRVNVSQPDVADLNLIGPESILLTAKKPGTTQMIIWDDANRSQVV